MEKNCSACGHTSIKKGNYCEICGNKLKNSSLYRPYLIGGGSALIVLAISHIILINLVWTLI